jgi:PEP-CTERM motif
VAWGLLTKRVPIHFLPYMTSNKLYIHWSAGQILRTIALVFLAAPFANATVYLDDNFNSYSNGDLVGQGGWNQTAAASPAMQVANGQVVIGKSGQDVYKGLSSTVPNTSGTSLYTVFDITLTSVQSAGDYFLHLSSPLATTSLFYQRVFARSSGTGFVLGLLDTSGTGSATTWGTTELSLSTLYSVTVAWNFIEGANNDTFDLYVGGSSTPYLTHTWTSPNAEPTTIAAANLRQGSASNSPEVLLDNLVVTDVNPIPEPSTYGLFILGVGAVLWKLRRQCA